MADERRIKDGEEILLICSPETEKALRDAGIDQGLVVASWVEDKSCVIVRKDDWDRMIDNGEVWGPKEE